MIRAYIRISTRKQSLERQRENIKREYPTAKIYEEVFTGTKVVGRKEWQKLMNDVVEGDTIVFDSVSRMSRNAEQGVKDYFELFRKGVKLVFLKEPTINTEVYEEVLGKQIAMTDTEVDEILIGVNKYLKRLAEKQIQIAFEQAEKEVNDLSERTKETLAIVQKRLKAEGKSLGQPKGAKLTTKKSVAVKQKMLEVVKEFGGYTDKEEDILKVLEISRNTYYKYKKELRQELADKGELEMVTE